MIDWIDVTKIQPPFNRDVLVLLDRKQMELWPEEPRYCRIGRLHPRFAAFKSFWVWISAWDHEPLESEDTIVTHWAELTLPREKMRIG